jgi:hypothetical protein
MADKVEIANLALQEMGAEPITSLSDDQKTARVINLRFDSLRDSFLRMHSWNFAKARARLSRLEDSPAFGFRFAYALPSDWLRTLHVTTDASTKPEHQVTEPHYQIEGKQLLADHDEVFMMYLRRVTNTEEWDELALDAFVLFLASRTARAITQNLDLAQSLADDFRIKLGEARFYDATDEPAQRLESDEWLVSRFHGGTHGLVGNFFGDIDTSGS